MVGDDVEAARLERGEHRRVQARAVDAHGAEVVVVEHQGDQIEAAGRGLGRRRALERLHDRDDARGGRRLQPLRRHRGVAPRPGAALWAKTRPLGATARASSSDV